MASSIKLPLILFFACSIFIQRSLAEVICERLPSNKCAFAVASSGKRCSLENSMNEHGKLDYMCTTSEVVVVERLAGHIETDQCVSACGVDREFVGISSDAFLAPEFIDHLCSPDCYHNCANIVDLYFNLAAGEGVFLPALCERQKSNPHRAMLAMMRSSGGVPSGNYAVAPAPAPAGKKAASPAPAPAGKKASAPAPAPAGKKAASPALAPAGKKAAAPAPAPASR